MTWRHLLCHDGSDQAVGGETMLRALRLIPDAAVDILGVVEPGHDAGALEPALRATADRLGAQGVATRLVLRRGHAAEEILRQADETLYDLVVTGAHGRRGLTRFLLGSTSARLARHLPTSLLVSRKPPAAVERILICTGGEETALTTLDLEGRIAVAAGADVTLLHVMSQVALTWESPFQDLVDTAESAIARNSPEGAHLRRAVEQLTQAGLTRAPNPVLRHGLVVDEVIDQIEVGGAQLLMIGAHRPPSASGAFAPFLDDIADQLLTHAPCSVLVVRA